MRIVFICGSLEPGNDGVGDYVQRLAGSLIEQGHYLAAVALNDRHIREIYVGDQKAGDQHLPVLRIPSLDVSKSKKDVVIDWLQNFKPDLISLQFVPFAFHDKGLPFGLTAYLKTIGRKAKWHIMFHELWVGMESKATLKLRLWGTIQKRMIRHMIGELQPVSIHTNTFLYREQLKALGYKAKFLQLFSNIPYVRDVIGDYRNVDCTAKANDIYLVVFGTIHPGAPVETFAKKVAEYSKNNKKNVILRIIGRCGMEQKKWEDIWTSEGLQLHNLGERSPGEISVILGSSSIGITTNPISRVQKSGTVSAMLGHNLPVLCVADAWNPRIRINYPEIPGVLEFSIDNLELCLNRKVTFSDNQDVLSAISNQFINDITGQEE